MRSIACVIACRDSREITPRNARRQREEEDFNEANPRLAAVLERRIGVSC